MKRIEFLAPVRAMRGNLSGDQVLRYNGDKRPYDIAGSGVVAAENYEDKYIGAKRFNGKKFFSLKTASRTSLVDSSRLAMAAFGGACSLAKAAANNITVMTALQNIFVARKAKGAIPAAQSFRNWIQTEVYPMLKTKQVSVTISEVTDEQTYTCTINNPWKTGGSGTDVAVPADIQSKFNAVLSA